MLCTGREEAALRERSQNTIREMCDVEESSSLPCAPRRRCDEEEDDDEEGDERDPALL